MDGSIQTLTPELSIKTQRGGCSLWSSVFTLCVIERVQGYIKTPSNTPIQKSTELGADIILTLDECTPFHVDKSYTEASMERSHRWELRSLAEFVRGDDGTQVCVCVRACMYVFCSVSV